MAVTINAKLGNIPGKKGMVVSHERSGTHFLMNTLALNFSYIAKPWINFDFELGLNFHASSDLQSFFKQIEGKPILNLVKSHHQLAFFTDFVDELADDFHIFYIYRDPRDVMASFWRMIQHLGWDEGPKTETVGQFMRSAPSGGLLRYQKEQVPNMVYRWQAHVEDWLALAHQDGGEHVIAIRYENLNLEFDETVKRIGERIERPVQNPVRPDKNENVVVPGTGKVGGHRELFTAEDLEFVRTKMGETMERLNIPFD